MAMKAIAKSKAVAKRAVKPKAGAEDGPKHGFEFSGGGYKEPAPSEACLCSRCICLLAHIICAIRN